MRKEEFHLKFFMCVIQSRGLVRPPQRTGTIVSRSYSSEGWLLLQGV